MTTPRKYTREYILKMQDRLLEISSRAISQAESEATWEEFNILREMLDLLEKLRLYPGDIFYMEAYMAYVGELEDLNNEQ
jgi:hypothetical protein